MTVAKRIWTFLTLAAVSACVISAMKRFYLPEAGDSFEIVWMNLCVLVIWHWLYYDAVDWHYQRPMSFGLQLQSFWWLAVPCYLVGTRGAKGFGVLLLLVLYLVGPEICREITPIP